MHRLRPWNLIVCSIRHWSSDNASTLGAALAFYCAFSLAPLLVLMVAAIGWIVGSDAAYSYLGHQLASLFGAATADVLLNAARKSQSADGIVAGVISGVTLLVGASSVFSALEGALELIWGSQSLAKPGIRGFLGRRLLSLGFVIAVGFLLAVSLTFSTALSALRASYAHRHQEVLLLAGSLEFALTTLLITALFSLAYRYMPSKRVAWRPTITGALITALLFQIGRGLIGLYLGKSTQPTAFGAAASFVALLLWLYYSAQIFLLGAEFTACLAGLRDATPAEQRDPRRLRVADGSRSN